MGVGFLRHKLAEKGLGTYHQVFSAGIWAVDDHPASENSVTVMAERGIDINDHVAHTVTADDMAEADLILVMSREHERALKSTWPQYEWKVYRLSEMVGKRKDVQDPYGGSVREYRACADIIENYIQEGFARIQELI